MDNTIFSVWMIKSLIALFVNSTSIVSNRFVIAACVINVSKAPFSSRIFRLLKYCANRWITSLEHIRLGIHYDDDRFPHG